MYKYQEILEEKLIILKEYVKQKNMECDKTMVRDYLMKIKISNKGEFNLYYKPSKNKFTPQQATLDSEVYRDIVEFIENGWVLDSKNKFKSDSYKKVDKENNAKIKKVIYLRNVYEVISKYKDCNIEFEDLINAIKEVCTEEEYKYIKNNDFNFDSLEKITLGYISN